MIVLSLFIQVCVETVASKSKYSVFESVHEFDVCHVTRVKNYVVWFIANRFFRLHVMLLEGVMVVVGDEDEDQRDIFHVSCKVRLL